MNNIFTFTGFGFPVLISNITFVEHDNQSFPNINYPHLAKSVLTQLATSKYALTGNQVKFIRKQLNLSLEAFGNLFRVSHPAVIKWESKGDSATGMAYSNEVLLRLHLLKFLNPEQSLLEDFTVISQNSFTEAKPDILLN